MVCETAPRELMELRQVVDEVVDAHVESEVAYMEVYPHSGKWSSMVSLCAGMDGDVSMCGGMEGDGSMCGDTECGLEGDGSMCGGTKYGVEGDASMCGGTECGVDGEG